MRIKMTYDETNIATKLTKLSRFSRFFRRNSSEKCGTTTRSYSVVGQSLLVRLVAHLRQF